MKKLVVILIMILIFLVGCGSSVTQTQNTYQSTSDSNNIYMTTDKSSIDKMISSFKQTDKYVVVSDVPGFFFAMDPPSTFDNKHGMPFALKGKNLSQIEEAVAFTPDLGPYNLECLIIFAQGIVGTNRDAGLYEMINDRFKKIDSKISNSETFIFDNKQITLSVTEKNTISLVINKAHV